MKTSKLFLFQVLILFLSASVFAAEKAYISVDESGQVEASDRPPSPADAKEATKVISMPGSSESKPASEADEWQERMERIDRMNEEMATELEQREAERVTAEENRKLQDEACAASQSRLQQLESQPPNRRLVIDSDGTTHRVTTEEMESLLEAARNQVEQDCGSLD